MGEAAVSTADRVIVTTDNPRMEDPRRIVEDITAGLSSADFEVIEDRTQAIEQAILPARVGDVVLLAGKGHETYQDIRGTKHPFDEVEIVSAVTEGLA
jgi:UDP-N-acetylmuramoyl-L-alanyl-D-glutamate--2,6-diaminopimelate ligase